MLSHTTYYGLPLVDWENKKKKPPNINDFVRINPMLTKQYKKYS